MQTVSTILEDSTSELMSEEGEAERFWWPLTLSVREKAAVEQMAQALQAYPDCHDRRQAEQASKLLDVAMSNHVAAIVERDSLPHACHLINGWGNARFAGGGLLDVYGRFVQRDSRGAAFIPQRATEGDFHPWQSFAYALMAGVDPEAPLQGTGVTLLDVAIGSRMLGTDDGCELGHLLYAAALFGFDTTTEFVLHDQVYDLCRLVDMAIDAHHQGHFKVCRKVHLTEGLCAMAAAHPGLSEYRAAAQGFLGGQLDQLVVLATVVRGVLEAKEQGGTIAAGSVVEDLRQSLVIERFVENHYYLAGHLIELLALAKSMGYAVTTLQWQAARFVTDALNRLLPEYVSRVWFPGCFLHFGHYRRAVTLLEEIAEGSALDAVSRARFTADFSDAPMRSGRNRVPASDDGIFTVGKVARQMRPEFEAIVEAYRDIAAPGLEPRGDFAHHRRILVEGWPRWLHFELLDYAAAEIDPIRSSGFGVELHIEQAGEGAFVAALAAIQQRLDPLLSDSIESDTIWYGAGRLCVLFDEGAAPERVACALCALIGAAYPVLAPVVARSFPVTVRP